MSLELSSPRRRASSPYTQHPIFSARGPRSARWTEITGRTPENYDAEALVDKIFSGAKAALRPVYEQILEFGIALGSDVRVCPCATIIPFYKKHVFAQVKVPNRSRIDLGFAFGDTPPPAALPPEGVLIDTGGFAKKDRITHRIEIANAQDFGREAKTLFRRAYERGE